MDPKTAAIQSDHCHADVCCDIAEGQGLLLLKKPYPILLNLQSHLTAHQALSQALRLTEGRHCQQSKEAQPISSSLSPALYIM